MVEAGYPVRAACDDPAADQARAQAAAAAKVKAQAEARARVAAEKRAEENAAAEAEHKKQAGIGQQVGRWLNGVADATWNGMKSAGNWVADHTDEILIGAGIIGFAACLVVTVGTCVAVGAALAVAGAANDRFVNKRSWTDTGKTFALNIAFVGVGGGLGAGLKGFLKGTAPLTRVENAGIGASTGAPGLSCTAIAIRGSPC